MKQKSVSYIPEYKKKRAEVGMLSIMQWSFCICSIGVNVFSRVARQHKIHNAILAAHSIYFRGLLTRLNLQGALCRVAD